jgi:hypothetical protein
MYTLLKMEEAAKELGLGITALKKYCRKHGIKRWPHRQVKEKYLCNHFNTDKFSSSRVWIISSLPSRDLFQKLIPYRVAKRSVCR